MSLNEVKNMRELQLHGVIHGLNKDLSLAIEENSNLKLKIDAIVERAEVAERELMDREESIYRLMLKLIACESQLSEIKRNQDLELLDKTNLQEREIEALRLSVINKDMRIKNLESELGLKDIDKLKVVNA